MGVAARIIAEGRSKPCLGSLDLHNTSRVQRTSSPLFSNPMKALARASVAPTVIRVSVCQLAGIPELASE